MEELPIEVLANHLFKYFTFSEWLHNLVPVCKLWQQAAISSNTSKQLVLDLTKSKTRQACVPIIAKYRIDTLLLLDSTGTSGSLLERIFNASPKLNTLVFVGSGYDHEALTSANSRKQMIECKPKRTFPHITTLSVDSAHFALLQVFPNVTRLRIEDATNDEELFRYTEKSNIPVFIKIKELEITQPHFGGWEGIQHQFPNLETLYVTTPASVDATAEIISEGKERGIKVVCDNKHLSKTSWNLPNISYRLYTKEHRKTPLAYPATIANAECSEEKFLEIMAMTSPAYEKELAKRIGEFEFPARVMAMSIDPSKIGSFQPIRKPYLIKILYANKFIEFWWAFYAAVNVGEQHDVALELSKDLVDNLENTEYMIESSISPARLVVKLFERINNTQLFLDAVGAEAVKKIMSTTIKGDRSVIAAWAISDSGDIDWKPIDEFIDWNMKVKVNSDDKENAKLENLATTAFGDQKFNKWKYLINEKKLETEFDLITDAELRYFARLGEDIELLAKNPEMKRRLLFATALVCADDANRTLLPRLISIIGSEQLTECYNGEYLLQYIMKNTSRQLDILFQYLVNELKFDINYIDNSGKTPLTTFIPTVLQESEDYSYVEDLLSLGADPNLAGDTMLPLFSAMELTTDSLLRVIETLIDAGADINAVDFDKNGRRATPLSMAVSKGLSVEIIETLLSRGADPKFVDDAGNTLIHTLLLAEGLDDILQLLPVMVRHVDINQVNLLNETPLHRALLSGYDASLISALVKHGADVNQRGGWPNQPPLIMALNYFPTVKVLLNSDKIDIKAKNTIGESAFYALCRLNCTPGDFEDVSALLADKEFQQIAAKLATPENIEFIVSEVKRYVNDYPQNFSNLFMLCTREMTLLKFLIETVGFDINSKASNGKTLLSSLTVNARNSFEIAEYLIQKGADVNVQDSFGDTPLLKAVRLTSVTREQYRYRQLLLKQGASVTLKNNLGVAPIDIDPLIESHYKEEELSMAFYDDRTVAELLTPSLAELRKKKQGTTTIKAETDAGSISNEPKSDKQ